jgi:hypothetical protein
MDTLMASPRHRCLHIIHTLRCSHWHCNNVNCTAVEAPYYKKDAWLSSARCSRKHLPNTQYGPPQNMRKYLDKIWHSLSWDVYVCPVAASERLARRLVFEVPLVHNELPKKHMIFIDLVKHKVLWSPFSLNSTKLPGMNVKGFFDSLRSFTVSAWPA